MAAAAALILMSGTARAQEAPKWELSAFGGRIGAVHSPATAALLTPNTAGAPAPTVPLFTVTLSEDSNVILGGRVGRYLTPSVEIEGAFSVGSPTVSAAVSGDARGAAAQTFPYANGREASLDAAFLMEKPIAGGSIRPFATASAGWLRQTISGGASLNGQSYRIGGGAKFVMAHPGAGSRGRAGIRADLVDAIRTRVFDSSANPSAHHALMATVSVFLAF
jgi:hypothetical protein